MSIVPNLAGFSPRKSPNVIGGQARYSAAFNQSKWKRSSLLSATSAPVGAGRVVAYTTTPPNEYGQQIVQAVNTPGYIFVASDFAGMVSRDHEDRLNRADIPLLSSDPNAYANDYLYSPGDYIPRVINEAHWFETDLTVAPAIADPVTVLPDGRIGAIGVALPPSVRYTGELATGFNGLRYVCVNILYPLSA